MTAYHCPKCGKWKCFCAAKERAAERAKRPGEFCGGCGRDLKEQLRQARAEALEEAAKVADRYAETAEKYQSKLMQARANESRSIAAAIRALAAQGRHG